MVIGGDFDGAGTAAVVGVANELRGIRGAGGKGCEEEILEGFHDGLVES